MRTRALSGALLLALSVVPSRTAGQSYAQLDLSYGLFDGVGVGMTSVAYAAEHPASGARVVTNSYGIYSDVGGGYRGSRSRYSNRYDDHSDWCWDEAWDLRWGRGYYGWHTRYDHLDFYHDCLSSGVGYAYDRWQWHARRAYYRPYDHYDWGWGVHVGWGRGVQVSVYVTDPFWRPWGPYWSYDPWGWYWDGHRDGWRDAVWARPAVAYGGPYRGVVYAGSYGGRVRGRPSPLAPTRFKEDPRVLASDGGVRRAQPRAQPVAAPVAPTRSAGRPSARGGEVGTDRAPTAPAAPRRGDRRGEPRPEPTGPVAGRPTDRIRGGEPMPGAEGPALQPDRGSATARPRPSAPAGGAPRARPSDPTGEAPRARPSAPVGDAPRARPSARVGGTERAQPSDPSVGEGTDRPSARTPARATASRPTPSAPATRARGTPSGARGSSEPSRAPAAARAPRTREPSAAPAPRTAPRAEGGESRGSSGQSEAPAPRAERGGAVRRPATR